jgi:hypothetical protein
VIGTPHSALTADHASQERVEHVHSRGRESMIFIEVDQGIQAHPAFVDYGFSARPLVVGCAMVRPAEGA